MSALLASIPSPDTSLIELGPLSIHMYGLTLLVAIAAAVALTGYRWTRLGGDWDLVFRAAVWGVAFGIVGARLYHVVTSWNEVPDEWWGVFAVWKGGLGVWGGIACGVVAGAVVVWRSGESVRLMMDCVAPGLLLAQGIGRVGNYFNQELFGKPTDLPWALQIDPEHRPAQYAFDPTFHPTFLYEAIYDVIGVGLLIWIGSRFRIKPPGLFALYVAYYTFGRTFEELLRVDPAHELFGLRLNGYVSIALFVISVAFFIWWQFIREDVSEPKKPERREPPAPRERRAVPKGRVRPSR
jgi:phosphatidylglycerol---prolipoprotein diacylglyceryl transferase